MGKIGIATRWRRRRPFLTGLWNPESFEEPMWISPPEWKHLVPPPNSILAPSLLRPEMLGECLKEFGSNQSTIHDYHIPLAFAFNIAPKGSVVEIGVAASRTHSPADGEIGEDEVVGASLHAWQRLSRFDSLIGIDYDKRFLETNDCFYPLYGDQHDLQGLEKAMRNALGRSPTGIAMIIDDGAHTHKAIVNTATVARSCLKPGGVLAIEDLDRLTLQAALGSTLTTFAPRRWGLWINWNRAPNNCLLILQT